MWTMHVEMILLYESGTTMVVVGDFFLVGLDEPPESNCVDKLNLNTEYKSCDLTDIL